MKRSAYRRIKVVIYRCFSFSFCAYLSAKHWALAPYYQGLAVQARYLYRTSELFRLRWQALGYQYAVESFDDGEVSYHFFSKARKEHWRIRLQIFIDATLGRKLRPYYLNNDWGF